MCLSEKGHTNLYVYKHGFLETKRAFSVVLAKQTLDNGVPIKSGTRIWIPGTGDDSAFAIGHTQVKVPNWKLNEMIRTYNLDQIRKS
jgi:hypothetical protein